MREILCVRGSIETVRCYRTRNAILQSELITEHFAVAAGRKKKKENPVHKLPMPCREEFLNIGEIFNKRRLAVSKKEIK